jgi:Ion transport protein
MYIYSIIGMIYFGEVKRNGSMNDYINFENFTSAFITVFSVATLDSWNFTTESFTHGLRPDNQCIDSPTYEDYKQNGYATVGCSNRTSAFTFFISYMFTVSLVFLKLLIAIILEQYDHTQN